MNHDFSSKPIRILGYVCQYFMRLFYFSSILMNHKGKNSSFLFSLIKRRSILFRSYFYHFVAQHDKISGRFKSPNHPLVLDFYFSFWHGLCEVIVLLFLSTKGVVGYQSKWEFRSSTQSSIFLSMS